MDEIDNLLEKYVERFEENFPISWSWGSMVKNYANCLKRVLKQASLSDQSWIQTKFISMQG